ncbi:hypothetical protein [Paenibacillus hexagrammi]|uniref:Uncharacterized protein n=1 Tax=Paenibacillus hexagrammi TaxID=2908839 RepID=A0ABY3SG60_9BACL|nr:hypothetical protein [Paenibacillus sp. YPD9-1]UJF32822.1 hypothetical protein L0M14_25115 [Paenibacillus sp. YPD9-1]
MKNAILLILLLCIFLITQTVSAKMSIIPPQDMLNCSDYIVVGKVLEQISVVKNRAIYKKITLSVEDVLKGQLEQKEIVLKRDVHFHPGEVPYDFPSRGTTVMLLLRNNTDGLSLTYQNSICTIQKDRISLYDGIGFDDWSANEYEET